MTHRGPCQPLPFCDSVIPWSAKPGAAAECESHFLISAVPAASCPPPSRSLSMLCLQSACASAEQSPSVTSDRIKNGLRAPKGSRPSPCSTLSTGRDVIAACVWSWAAFLAARCSQRGNRKDGESLHYYQVTHEAQENRVFRRLK